MVPYSLLLLTLLDLLLLLLLLYHIAIIFTTNTVIIILLLLNFIKRYFFEHVIIIIIILLVIASVILIASLHTDMEIPPHERKAFTCHAKIFCYYMLRHVWCCAPIVSLAWYFNNTNMIQKFNKVVHTRDRKWFEYGRYFPNEEIRKLFEPFFSVFVTTIN